MKEYFFKKVFNSFFNRYELSGENIALTVLIYSHQLSEFHNMSVMSVAWINRISVNVWSFSLLARGDSSSRDVSRAASNSSTHSSFP